MGKRVNTYRILVKKPGGKRPLGRPRFKRENDINVGIAVAQWLRCCATNRKVAGVSGIFH